MNPYLPRRRLKDYYLDHERNKNQRSEHVARISQQLRTEWQPSMCVFTSHKAEPHQKLGPPALPHAFFPCVFLNVTWMRPKKITFFFHFFFKKKISIACVIE